MTNDAVYYAGEFIVYAEIASLLIHVWLLAAAGVTAVTPE
jgi:hypothetical protein